MAETTEVDANAHETWSDFICALADLIEIVATVAVSKRLAQAMHDIAMSIDKRAKAEWDEKPEKEDAHE